MRRSGVRAPQLAHTKAVFWSIFRSFSMGSCCPHLRFEISAGTSCRSVLTMPKSTTIFLMRFGSRRTVNLMFSFAFKNFFDVELSAAHCPMVFGHSSHTASPPSFFLQALIFGDGLVFQL